MLLSSSSISHFQEWLSLLGRAGPGWFRVGMNPQGEDKTQIPFHGGGRGGREGGQQKKGRLMGC